MLKLVVIADDFTGALDTGVQFSNQGIKTLVSTDLDINYSEIEEDIKVIVIDTESRYLRFEDAYNRIEKIIVSVKQHKVPYVYKKVDSALRGNISAEIKAVLDTYDETVIPFLPAYPEMNRVVVDGDLYIDGTLVSESVFASDPYEPVTESNILKRLKTEAGITSQLIKGNKVPVALDGIAIFDAKTDAELEEQMVMLDKEGLLSVSIGCAGFAKILAKRLFPSKNDMQYTLKKPLVVMCGSVNPITKKQVEYVDEKEYPRISLTPYQLLSPQYWSSDEGEKDIKRYLEIIDSNSLVVFETLSEETISGLITYSKEHGISSEEYRFRIGISLGELTLALWSKHLEHTFLFTGGDTLFQSMKVLGIKTIEPLAEISAGVVLSTIEWKQQKVQVITKSGGFGEVELFENITQTL